MIKKHLLASFFFLSLVVPISVFAEPVWVDVRSVLEHAIDNIEGDVRIPHGDIVEEFSALYPDKDTQVKLYCRSGGRAETALNLLKEAGYKNVLNAGGIDDARVERVIAD